MALFCQRPARRAASMTLATRGFVHPGLGMVEDPTAAGAVDHHLLRLSMEQVDSEHSKKKTIPVPRLLKFRSRTSDPEGFQVSVFDLFYFSAGPFFGLFAKHAEGKGQEYSAKVPGCKYHSKSRSPGHPKAIELQLSACWIMEMKEKNQTHFNTLHSYL